MTSLSLLSRGALVAVLTGAACIPLAHATPDRAAVEAAFGRADLNKDGLLSKGEAAQLPAIAARFGQLDSNKDGSLSLEEFAVGYTAAD